MDRRSFLKTSAAAGAVASVPAVAEAHAAKTGKKLNVLYVFDDEHRFQTLPGDPYNGEVLAPTLDAFRRQNMCMEQCISNYPLCSPHRGMLMTGMWPYENGVMRNWIQLGTNFQSLGHTFAKAGYRTQYVGKWHLSGPGFDRAFVPPGPHRQGWQDWHVWGSVDKHMNVSFTFNPDTGEKIHPMGYQPTLMTDQAVSLIESNKTLDQPWILVVSWHPPHFPTNDAPEADEATYRDKPLKTRPNINTGHGLGPLSSPEALQVEQRGYYAHITALDREFARLMKALQDTGQADDTIVIFTSDHGEMLGSHGRMHKRVPYEESIRVPFFARVPGNTKAGSSDTLFASIDLYPTVCGLAGVPVPAFCRGKDLSSVVTGQAKRGPNDHVFLMNVEDLSDEGKMGPPPPNFRGVRTATHTYAVAIEGRWFLYDNSKDPLQQHNLIDDPAEKARIAAFDTMIAAWLQSASDPFPYQDAVGKRFIEPVYTPSVGPPDKTD